MSDGTINRTMRVLNTLALNGPSSLKELSEAVGLTSTTVLRFLRILAEDGYVEQSDDRSWRASLEVWRMGAAVLAAGGWSTTLADVVHEVARSTGESTVYVAYRDGWVMYVAAAPSVHPVRTHIELGTRFHASEVNTGIAALAHLPTAELDDVMTAHWGTERWAGDEGEPLRDRLQRVRKDGYTSANSQRWRGVWGLAAPVMGRSGQPVGAIGLSVPGLRRPDESAVAEHVLAGAQRLSGIIDG